VRRKLHRSGGQVDLLIRSLALLLVRQKENGALCVRRYGDGRLSDSNCAIDFVGGQLEVEVVEEERCWCSYKLQVQWGNE
jgi:hypothetical protein